MELSNVLWIGGPSGAGKTTTARLLARRHGLRWYSGDTMTWVHRDRALAAGLEVAPHGPGVRGPDRMQMFIDDLRSMPASPLIVAEGGLTAGIAKPTSQAVWLMPSKNVQRARLQIRHPEGVPPAYLTSWDWTVKGLGETTITTIAVDQLTVDETVDKVERVFMPYIANGPNATGMEERRSLIRYGNRAIVAQHAWSPAGNASVRLFDCECAARSCEALVELSVCAAAAAVQGTPPAILASEH